MSPALTWVRVMIEEKMVRFKARRGSESCPNSKFSWRSLLLGISAVIFSEFFSAPTRRERRKFSEQNEMDTTGLLANRERELDADLSPRIVSGFVNTSHFISGRYYYHPLSIRRDGRQWAVAS